MARVSLRTETSQKTRLDETVVSAQGLWGLFSVQGEGKRCNEHHSRAHEYPLEALHWW